MTVTKPLELNVEEVVASDESEAEKPRSQERRELASGRPSAQVSVLPVAKNRGSAKRASAKPEIVEQIGHRLASVYNSVLTQPIPPRFLDLLADLEAGHPPASNEKSKKKDGK